MLVTHLYTEQLFDGHTTTPWKLQMTVVSSQRCLMFVAQSCYVCVYRISHHARLPVFEIRLPYPEPPTSCDEINAITLGRLHGKEVIVAVYDSGLTAAW
ncbi:hypothetical protein GGH14_006534, partial [Coemansia sp. RSA 370]